MAGVQRQVNPRATKLARFSRVFKWALMSGIVFWTCVYKASDTDVKLPGFVYVNF